MFIAMMRNACVALVLGMGSTPASAAVMQAVYSGYVEDGYDFTGVFGEANRILDGKTFRIIFFYQTDVHGRNPGVDRDSAVAGDLYGSDPPLGNAHVTIGGEFWSIGGWRSSSVFLSRTDAGIRASHRFTDYHDYDNGSWTREVISANGLLPDDGTSVSLEKPLRVIYPDGFHTVASFDLYGRGVSDTVETSHPPGTTSNYDGEWRYPEQTAAARLAVTSIRIDRAGSVDLATIPLPATAGLMLLGLGAIAALRARRRARPPAAP